MRKQDGLWERVSDVMGGKVLPLLSEFREKISATEDIHALEAMFTLARRAKSIEDFKAKLEEIKCCM